MYSVGLTVRAAGEPAQTSGAYRPGFCYMELPVKKGVAYTVIPSTFNKSETGAFFVTAGSHAKLSFKPA